MKTILAIVLALSLSACGIGGAFVLPVEPDPNEPNASSPSDPADAGPTDGPAGATKLPEVE